MSRNSKAQIFKRVDSLSSSSGQALVEYILILVVSVAVLFGLLKIFYEPGRTFFNVLLGSYIECLIDYGELPFLGNTNSSTEECEGQLKTAASQFKGSTSSGINGTGGSSGLGDENGKNGKNKSSGDGDGDGSRSGGSGNSNGGGASAGADSGFGGRGKRFRVGSVGSGSAGANGSGKSSEPEALPDTKFMNTGSGSRYSYNGRSSRPILMMEMVAAEREKIKNRENKIFNAGVIEQGSSASKPRKLSLKVAERKEASVEEKQETWSIGKLFRIALIVVIILTLIFVVGGQMLQASKGGES